jgi:GT2 family glycosyltransferase
VTRDVVERLARARQAARAAKDFATADRLREEIRSRGFDVVDTAAGYELRRAARSESSPALTHASVGAVPSLLDAPPRHDVTVHWVVQGWPEDVVRGIESFRRHPPPGSVRHVVVEAWEGTHPWPHDVETIRIRADLGWAAARNAGLRRTTGRAVVVADGSIEATGDALSPLLRALEDPTDGITGPFGITTVDLRQFDESAGPDVDAIEGYLMAFRRDLLVRGVRFDERFRFYRTADIDLSFQVKALGLRAVVTPVPVVRHDHRMWETTPHERREQLSKRNFYRFLDRWRGRTDLLESRTRANEPG